MTHCISIKEISNDYKQIESEISTILSQNICTLNGIKKRLKNLEISDEMIKYILSSIGAKEIYIDNKYIVEKLTYQKRIGFIFHTYKETEGNFLVYTEYESFWQDKNSNVNRKQIKKEALELKCKRISQCSPEKKSLKELGIENNEIILYVDVNTVKGSYFDEFGHCHWIDNIGKIQTEKLITMYK